MPRNAMSANPESEVSIEARAVLDEQHYKDLLARAAAGEQDAIEELDARTLLPIDAPFGEYSVEQLKRDKLVIGRRAHKHIVSIAMTNVGLHLGEARARARMTQAEAAELLGISLRMLQRIEGGEKLPSLEFVLEASFLFGTHVERVLGFIDEGAERLLDMYECATPRNRKDMLESAEVVQGGGVPRFAQNIEQDHTERTLKAKRRMTERQSET